MNPGNDHDGHRQWRVQDVLVDQTIGRSFNSNASVNWERNVAHIDDKSPIHFFLRFFPMFFIAVILDNTNIELQKERNARLLEQWEFFRWIGIRITMGLERPRGSIEEIFSDMEIPGSVLKGQNYKGCFHMSYRRFMLINKCLRLAPSAQPSVGRVRFCFIKK